jgi:glutamate transport system permease protein
VSDGAAVLFDVPGPRARARNRAISIFGSIGLLAVLGYVVLRFVQTGQFSATKWSIFEYANVQRTILDGYVHTLTAAGTAALLALSFGTVLAVGRLSDRVAARGVAFAVVEVFRAIPLLLLMFLFYYGAPSVGAHFTPFWAVVLGLTLYNGSVFAELFRAGVEAVPRGQAEAAYAIGMRKGQVMRFVLLPQAIRSMLPAIISQLVVLLKDTALGFLVTYDELLKQLKQLATAGEFEFPLIPLVLVGGAMYVATCMLLAALARWLERRLNRSGRTAGPTAPEALIPGAVEVAGAGRV